MKLSRCAGEFLLSLLERPQPTITADVLDELLPGEGQILLDAGALTRHGMRRSAIVSDDAGVWYRDLDWQPETRSRGFFDAADGRVEVALSEQHRLTVSLQWFLAWLADAIGIIGKSRPVELLPGHAWDLGDIRITRTRRAPIVFARRLSIEQLRRSLREVLANRSGRSGGLVLTSSRSRAMDLLDLPSFAQVKLTDVQTNDPDVFAVDQGLLISPFAAHATANRSHNRLALSPDGRRLVINGQIELVFRGPVHIAIIRRLVEAHQSGCGLRAAELLVDAGSDVGTLARAFGRKRWTQLKPYLKSNGGLWGFEV